MAEETNIGKAELPLPSRRDVVTKAAQVAVTAPAVALLLNASTKSVFAACLYGRGDGCPVLDDFTFGNAAEDIDAIELGSNSNPFTGEPQQDDHV